MIVQCINNVGYEKKLILNKFYEGEYDSGHIHLKIIHEQGKEHGFYTHRFVFPDGTKVP